MLKQSSTRAKFVLAMICLLAFILMLSAAFSDSPIMDELAHIPAGYGYVRYLDYRLNPEHPPLLKALAALPLLALHLNFPTQSSAWLNQVNSEWTVGNQFLYQSGNDANTILHVARIVPILVTILLIILIWLWSKELLGPSWALLPAFLFGLSPTILAHGHYVTTDIAAALGILWSTWRFLKYLQKPTKKNFWYAGIVFGIAQLTKFSAVLLWPYFIILAIAYPLIQAWRSRVSLSHSHSHSSQAALGAPSSLSSSTISNTSPSSSSFSSSSSSKNTWRHIGKTLLATLGVFIVGTIIIYGVYFLFTIHYPVAKQHTDTIAILQSFAHGPTPAGKMCQPVRCVANLDIWMSNNHVTRPLAQFLLGVLMVTQRAVGGNTNYFLGHVSGSGTFIYFPVVFLLKETLPTLILMFVALLLTLIGWAKILKRKNKTAIKSRIAEYLSAHFTEAAIAFFVLFYWGYSVNSTLNIGVRHVIPTIPFLYILTASAWKNWLTPKIPTVGSMFEFMIHKVKQFFTSWMKYVFLFALLIWFLVETLGAAPYFLSYFNEIGGGLHGGYHYATDSNYDWGQDLERLGGWVATQPQINKIAVDYFGGGDVNYYLGNKGVSWSSAMGDPRKQGIHWLAVSIDILEDATQPTNSNYKRAPQDDYSWLLQARPTFAPGMGNVPKPDYIIGTTMYVYHLP